MKMDRTAHGRQTARSESEGRRCRLGVQAVFSEVVFALLEGYFGTRAVSKQFLHRVADICDILREVFKTGLIFLGGTERGVAG